MGFACKGGNNVNCNAFFKMKKEDDGKYYICKENLMHTGHEPLKDEEINFHIKRLHNKGGIRASRKVRGRPRDGDGDGDGEGEGSSNKSR